MTLVPLPASADNNIWMPQDVRHAMVAAAGQAGPAFEPPCRRSCGSRGNPQLAAILVMPHDHGDVQVAGPDSLLRDREAAVAHGPKAAPRP